MDRQELDGLAELDLGIDGAESPPAPPEDAGDAPRPDAPAPASGLVNTHLFTFVVVLFAALELQAILVLIGAADGGGAEAMTWVFGAIFMVSVFAWFAGGMLWFAKKFEQNR